MGQLPPVNGETQSLKFEVVVAGGGFAGVYCARSLAKQLGPISRTSVALIADQNFMVFQPMLAEVCGSEISPRHIVNPIRRICRGCDGAPRAKSRRWTLASAGSRSTPAPIRKTWMCASATSCSHSAARSI